MDQKTHDIDADGDFDGPPELTSESRGPSAAMSAGRPDASGEAHVPDPFDAPPAQMSPRTMYICAGVVGFGLLMVAAGLLFGGGRSEPRRAPVAPAQSAFSEQQRMAREAMSMAREAQRMQRERLELMRQEMEMAGDQGPVGIDAARTDHGDE